MLWFFLSLTAALSQAVNDKEKHVKERLFGASLMMLGVLVIGLLGVSLPGRPSGPWQYSRQKKNGSLKIPDGYCHNNLKSRAYSILGIGGFVLPKGLAF